jgi:hypothetical protein
VIYRFSCLTEGADATPSNAPHSLGFGLCQLSHFKGEIMKKLSQKEHVKQYLEEGNTITPLEALNKFGSFRLGAIIHTLRHEEEMDIINLNKTGPARFACYKLKREPKQESMFEIEPPTNKNPYEGGY